MKKLILTLFTLVLLVSCEKPPEPILLSEYIIGEWKLEANYSNPDVYTIIEFLATDNYRIWDSDEIKPDWFSGFPYLVDNNASTISFYDHATGLINRTYPIAWEEDSDTMAWTIGGIISTYTRL